MQNDNSSTVESVTFPSRERIKDLAVSESGFVFDPISGNNFTLNETGLDILRQLQHQCDFAQLLDYLKTQYAVDGQDMERDLIEFIGVLRDFVDN